MSTPIAIIASNEELDAFNASVEAVVDVRSVTEVEVSRSVAEGVDVSVEVDDWI